MKKRLLLRITALCSIFLASNLLSKGQQTGNSITQTRDGVTFTFTFECDGGPCTFGQFATGDYWVIPNTPTGTVDVTQIEPLGEENAAVVNPDLLRNSLGELLPKDQQRQGVLTNYSHYDANMNIMNSLPYTASADESIYKLKSQTNGCGTAGIANGCVTTAAVLTVLSETPPDNGTTVFRPPFHGTWKPLYSITKVRMDRLPNLPQVSDCNSGAIGAFEHWSAPSVEPFHQGFGELHRATIPHAAQTPYASDQCKTLLEDITKLFGTETELQKTPGTYTIIQKGIDNYGVFKMGIPFSSGAGQHPGKKPPITFFAALYDDPTLLEEVRSIATDPNYTEKSFFQEDSQIRMGPSGMAVWGDVTPDLSDIHWYFSRLYPKVDRKGTAGDPYGYIDGPAGGVHPDPNETNDRNYLPVVGGIYVGYSLLQHVMPWFKYASGDPEILLFSDRLYSGYGIPNFDGGLWTIPDPVAPYDTTENGCNPSKLYSTGITNCHSYGISWGANLSDFTQYIGHGGDPNTMGRMPGLHGYKIPLTRVPCLVNKHWQELRECSDPTHPDYPCDGLGIPVDTTTTLHLSEAKSKKEIEEDQSISVFSDRVIFHDTKYENIYLQVYNSVGQLIFSQTGNGNEIIYEYPLHKKGIYIYKILADRNLYSGKILVEDFQKIYTSCLSEKEIELAPITLQYIGFSAWQREYLKNPKLVQKELNYWKKQLSGYRNLDMVTDYPRQKQTSGIGSNFVEIIPSNIGNQLKEKAQKLKTTSFTLFVTAAYLLLYRMSRQTDICLGMPVANRSQKELEELVGFFVNTLILRINPADQSITTRELIEHVHQTITEGQSHQQLPVERILDVIKPPRDLSRSPIFQVLISYTPFSISSIPIGESEWFPVMPESNTAKFNLTFSFTQKEDDSVLLAIEYATDLFKESTIKTFASQIQNICKQMVQTLDIPVFKQDMLSEQERDFLVHGLNETQKEIPTNVTLHQLFDEQVNKTPHNIAIHTEKGAVSYGMLQQESDKLAIYLQQNGITSGDIVGFCMERSEQLIIAILAIWKAGAAYLPLDINYPTDRLLHMLSDSQTHWVVVGQETEKKIKQLNASVQLLNINNRPADFEGKIEMDYSPNQAAYVMYTSGSTGLPKGVVVTHQNVINHNLYAIKAYDLDSTDRILQFSSVSFDIFVEEVFPTLLCGASIVMMKGERFMDVHYLKSLVDSKDVTVLNLPTAYWHTLAEEDFTETSLKTVIIGGEKAEMGYYQRWNTNNPSVRVFNTYGPTEATVIALLHEIQPTDDTSRPIPIGKPIDNAQVYVLDECKNPVPFGAPGELYIGGAGVALGYFNKPALTTERFPENPFMGGKMYRTGDLVRWRTEEHVLEFLGRTDEQVKIRGFRIEPGEIENILQQLQGIREVAVVVIIRNDNKLLAAAYTGNAAEADIRSYLRSKLPEYMVPTLIQQKKKLPLNPNGKLDRKRIQQELITVEISAKEFIAPASEMEKQLSFIWQDVLGTEKISLTDSFFDLGGHSLLAIKLLSKINNAFGVSFPLSQIFETPILKDMVEVLIRSGSEGNIKNLKTELSTSIHSFTNSNQLRLLRKATKNEATILFPGMPGLLQGYEQLSKSILGNAPVYGIELPGVLNGTMPKTLQEISEYYATQINHLPKGTTLNFYAHSFGGTVLYETLRLLDDTKYPRNKVVLIDAFPLRVLEISTPEERSKFAIQITYFINITWQEEWFELSFMEDWDEQFIHVFAETSHSDKEIITRLWKTVYNALSMFCDYETKHPLEVDIILAHQNYANVEGHWQNCFNKINVYRSDGDHFSMIKEPFVSQWMGKLDKKEEVAIDA